MSRRRSSQRRAPTTSARDLWQYQAMSQLRAMVDSDVPAAVRAWDHAFQPMRAKYGLPLSTMTDADNLRLQRRMRHFLITDPDGSWVAEEDGVVVGLSQSFVRDGYWVLSMLATVPDSQGSGLGREL